MFENEAQQSWKLILRVDRDPLLSGASKARIMADILWNGSGLLDFQHTPDGERVEIEVAELFKEPRRYKRVFCDEASFMKQHMLHSRDYFSE